MTPDDTFKKLKTVPVSQAFAAQIDSHLASGGTLDTPFLVYLIIESHGKLEVRKIEYQKMNSFEEEYEYNRMTGNMPVYILKEKHD